MSGNEHRHRRVPSTLPARWYDDPLYRDEVHREIAMLERQGYTGIEIARRVGVTDRTVYRLRAKRRAES